MPICPNCKDKLEQDFQNVKKYVREHRRAELQEVSEECDVEVKQIQQWIREERLEFTSDSPVKIPCENCGAPIQSGRFCAKCKSTMSNNLSKAIEKPKIEPPVKKDVRDGNRMRFLDR